MFTSETNERRSTNLLQLSAIAEVGAAAAIRLLHTHRHHVAKPSRASAPLRQIDASRRRVPSSVDRLATEAGLWGLADGLHRFAASLVCKYSHLPTIEDRDYWTVESLQLDKYLHGVELKQ